MLPTRAQAAEPARSVVTRADFAAIHVAATHGWYPLGADLHASPDAPVTRAEAARALAVDHRNWFHPDLPLYLTDLRDAPIQLPAFEVRHPGSVKRRDWARVHDRNRRQ